MSPKEIKNLAAILQNCGHFSEFATKKMLKAYLKLTTGRPFKVFHRINSTRYTNSANNKIITYILIIHQIYHLR